ncbi:hypothetical protein [uncultured Shimia sp.]|uniref:hypothetical protein n=1 Tax=uncultured Shimia sp. TaxID=573152 RepID=UPI00261EBCA5|nr:hypothetical protein [uncultured Shimia sp.]
MKRIREREVPRASLLQQFVEMPGCHADAFAVPADAATELADYIRAMFDSPVFRAERMVLAAFGKKSSSAEEVAALAAGEGQTMALWSTLQRNGHELLLEVRRGAVRTWLMVEPRPGSDAHLWFGTAIVPEPAKGDAPPQIALGFRAFMGVHKLYSRVLLWAAVRGLKHQLKSEGR